jgi:hypothetical protein
MSWRKLFLSHHSEWLEEQFEKLKVSHLRELEDLKKAHAEELKRAIEDNARLRDETERMRIYLTPALQSVSTVPDNSAPPSPAPDAYTGTPWQRILKREIARQEAEAAARLTKPADAPVKGESNGNAGEGRNEAPLREPSASA